MTTCPEGPYTDGHLWMAALVGAMVAVVVVGILREIETRRPDG